MSQSEQVLLNTIEGLKKQLKRTQEDRDEFRELFMSVSNQLLSNRRVMMMLEETNEKYRKWFAYHAHWTMHHNRMIQWNPELGYPNIKGGNPEDGYPCSQKEEAPEKVPSASTDYPQVAEDEKTV